MSGRATGEPVVLVHGLGGQWQNWLENIPRLAQDRRVVAMDLPGFGLTPEPDGRRRRSAITRYGRWVNELCRPARARRRSTSSGNSMGGYIAAEVAIQFPERVSRLVLVSAAGISSAETLADADPHLRPDGRRARGEQPPRATGGSRRGRSRGTCRWRWWRAIRGC